MKRIGIFGGSFNPIHNGHVSLAKYIVSHQYVDEIWLMVSPQNPLKESNELIDERLRFAMATAATKHLEGVRASDFEFALPRPSFTWQTLNELKLSYPAYTFVLVIGSDNWLLFPKWANYEAIMENYEILIYPRPGYDINATTLPPNISLLQPPQFLWNSTEIRNSIKKGVLLLDAIPDAIVEQVKMYYK